MFCPEAKQACWRLGLFVLPRGQNCSAAAKGDRTEFMERKEQTVRYIDISFEGGIRLQTEITPQEHTTKTPHGGAYIVSTDPLLEQSKLRRVPKTIGRPCTIYTKKRHVRPKPFV